jgi:hypothetical protein
VPFTQLKVFGRSLLAHHAARLHDTRTSDQVDDAVLEAGHVSPMTAHHGPKGKYSGSVEDLFVVRKIPARRTVINF